LRTRAYLTVIGIALAVFLVFNTGMSWIRQYLVLHTGTRVDAVLGTQVFDHLLRLPPRYYEYRPTGVVVARLHGVETIRNSCPARRDVVRSAVPGSFWR
jgi:subfamily B ATP-binding cassette protein HlyB/CyaB